ncbi:ComF family protein [Parvularcula sp. IMCC14364]|uniref:ComF family protein n=1 Tax=Parvularcula sp. IMCC14364 TaxID=3067902 RepID=UPI00274044DC|nr:ComF family protein [Parvularcula sp. IMCC14364]
MQKALAQFLDSTRRGSISALSALRDTLLPPQCPVTGEQVLTHGGLSPRAWQQVSFIAPPLCDLCGIPFEISLSDALICGACAATGKFDSALISDKGLDRVRAAMRYDDVSANLALSLKYADRHDLVEGFAAMMSGVIAQLQTPETIVVPVPLHPRRLRRRRFNQAALLAKALAHKADLPVCLDFLERHRSTPQQQGLSAKARKRNVAGAFRIRDKYLPLQGSQHFLLVDDVLTTGSTLKECARVLKRAGAGQVNAVVLARVVKDDVIAI